MPKLFDFTLKILVLFEIENLKYGINFKFKIEGNSKFEIATTSKYNFPFNKSYFYSLSEKQIQNYRFASMAHQTEHYSWLK
ncbi:unnamed protein product, partial [Rotaria magnacalcarata]